MSGTASLALAALRPKLTADFKADDIVADNFVPRSGAAPTASKKPAGRPAGGAKPVASSGAPWTDEPIDIDALRAFDADIKVKAKSLAWRAWKIAAPEIDMTLDNGKFDLRRVSGTTVGGSFLASASVTAPAKKGGAVGFASSLDIAHADMSQALFNASEIDIVKGKVTARMRVTGQGATSRALASSLAGSGNMEVTDGAVTGFDLGRVNDQLKNLNKPTSFLNLLQTAMSGGSTNFSKLSGTFKIDKGVVRSTDIALAADGGSGTATLTADLPRWTIDAAGLFRLSGHKDAPAFRMALKGPLDQPRRIFNLNELQSWLFSRGAGALLQQFLKPKKKADPSTATQPSQPAPPKADEFIRGIFDMLQKKK
jgi:uncharacterized protein involved in outer membrane biogenesis